MNILRYYIRDARDGIRRNAGASLAAVLLIFISLTITGSLFLVKASVQDAVDFLNAQVKIRLVVDKGIDPQQVAQVLQGKSFVQTATVESKQEALGRLKQLFQGREYLFEAFVDSDFPDSVVVELQDKDRAQVSMIAEELKGTKGIADVIYAQEFARAVVDWTNRINRYGAAALGVFLLSSLLTVSLAVKLAIYQREKEIRIKLLLGAKASHVRGQFLLEGAILGVIGSILAGLAVYLFYEYGLYRLQERFGSVFQVQSAQVQWVLGGMMLGGLLIGLFGSYVSTRRRIRDA